MKKLLLLLLLALNGCKSINTEFSVENSIVTNKDTIAVFKIEDDKEGTQVFTRPYRINGDGSISDFMQFNDFDYATLMESKGYFVVQYKKPLSKNVRQIFSSIGFKAGDKIEHYNYGLCVSKKVFGYKASSQGVHLVGKLYLNGNARGVRYGMDSFSDDEISEIKELFPNIPLDNYHTSTIQEYESHFSCTTTIYI